MDISHRLSCYHNIYFNRSRSVFAIHFLIKQAMNYIDEISEERVELEKNILHLQEYETIILYKKMIGHDILNNLTIIQGFSEIGKNDSEIAEKTREMFDLIQASSLKATQILRGFLNAKIYPEEDELNEIVLKSFFQEHKADYEKIFPKNISFRFECAENIKLTFNLDKLHHLLLNLLVNSRDAIQETITQEQIKNGQVKLDVQQISDEELKEILKKCNRIKQFKKDSEYKGKYVAIQVNDNGSGISSEIQRNIFKPFVTSKSSTKGTGLGISIILNIIKPFNGILGFESSKNKGTTFWILLPLI